MQLYSNTEIGGKYNVMSNGDLYITNVEISDSHPTYRCKTTNILTKWVVAAGCAQNTKFNTLEKLSLHTFNSALDYWGPSFLWSWNYLYACRNGSAKFLIPLFSSSEIQTSAYPAKIIVTEPKGFVQPRINVEKQSVKHTTVNGQVTLSCIAQGFPPPSYRWFKEQNERLVPLQYNDRIYLITGGLLKIAKIRLEDKWVWQSEFE